MERIKYNGWECIRLTNGNVEVVVTRDIGPRIIRYGFVGGPNVLGEIPSHQGGRGEDEWMNRGGHRLWIAPEAFPWSYELDNEPYADCVAISGGVKVRQDAGPVTHIEKQMEIFLDDATGNVRVVHTLINRGKDAVRLAPWAITVMGLNGVARIPLPKKHPADKANLLPSQSMAIWPYTDFSDPRWTFGRDAIELRQDPKLDAPPQKIGIRNREGFVTYEREGMVFTKTIGNIAGGNYPDFGVNCEVYTNNEILEIESIGPMTTLANGDEVEHVEEWSLARA